MSTATRSPAVRLSSPTPTLRHERALLREGHRWVAGMDEVGRGALAGPVSVGVVLVDLTTRSAPPGLRDSKLLTPLARTKLSPRLRRWAPQWAVGHAEADEIDRLGIIAALRLAGRRALAQVTDTPSIVLLDGSHDWLSPPQPTLFDALDPDVLGPDVMGVESWRRDAWRADLFGTPVLGPRSIKFGEPGVPGDPGLAGAPRVRTMIKADRRCASVAAASVLAKTTRDAMMVARASEHPGYGWDINKGYSAPAHIEAIARAGVCPQHRLSWRMPGMMDCELDPAQMDPFDPELAPELDLDPEVMTDDER